MDLIYRWPLTYFAEYINKPSKTNLMQIGYKTYITSKTNTFN